MLQLHELSKAQGLPEDYIIDKAPEDKYSSDSENRKYSRSSMC